MAILPVINIRKSFAARVCILTIAATACVFLVSFGFGLYFASEGMLAEGHEKADLELDKARLHIENQLTDVEVASNNFAITWSCHNLRTPEKAQEKLEEFIALNPAVLAAAIAYEPEYYPEYPKGFAYFTKQLTTDQFRTIYLPDYYNVYEKFWYKESKDSGQAHWTSPFTETNGSIVCCFTQPLFDDNGNVFGVLAVDMGLAELSIKMQSIKPYASSYIAVFDKDFRFIVHPETDKIMDKSMSNDSIATAVRNYFGDNIANDLFEHKTGYGQFLDKGDEKYLYYSPIDHTDWTIVLQCDEDEITAALIPIRLHMIWLTLVSLVILFTVMLIAIRHHLRPVKIFSQVAHNIANGKYNTAIPDSTYHDELWRLGKSLDEMQKALASNIETLKQTTREKGRIENELHIASQIQMSMLPKIFPPYPDRDDLDIFGAITPAKEVGGDLYDFFLRDEKLFFCIGDVSGKGVPASLVMVVTRSLVRSMAAKESHPDRILEMVNRTMAENNTTNMFITMFIGVLDMTTGRLRYCNAGHNAPVISSAQGGIRMLDVRPNLPLAVMEDVIYEEQDILIEPQTQIFIYTDGLTEAENSKKELFGDDRMLEELSKTMGQDAKTQVSNMLNAVHQHVNGAEQSDDLTMMSIICKHIESNDWLYRKLNLTNDVRETPKIYDLIDSISSETDIEPALASSINLALEEAVVNVMNYAYPKNMRGTITIDAMVSDDQIKLTITDNGIPFDPTETGEPDITADINDRPIGGLGIFLVRHIMDELKYERVDDCNVFTMIKNLKKNSKNA